MKSILLLVILLLVKCSTPHYTCLSEDCESGKGKLRTRYCDLYEGEIKNGEPFGYGIMKYAGDKCVEKGYTRAMGNDVDYYKGTWGKNKNGYTRWEGKGEMSLNTGFKLIGTFSDDSPAYGQEMTIVLPNGKTYKGTSKNGN